MLEHGATGHCTSSGGHPDALTTHLPSEKWCLWDPAWNYTPPVGERDKNEHPGVPHAWQKLPTGTIFGPSTVLARQPRVPMCLQAWVPTVTYHTLFSRSVVSHHQHHRATGNERRKWQSQGSGWAPCPGRCLCSSYRSVLALGTVPGRLMSRSLRLEERERASVSM